MTRLLATGERRPVSTRILDPHVSRIINTPNAYLSSRCHMGSK